MVAPAASWMPIGELSRRTGVSSDLLRKSERHRRSWWRAACPVVDDLGAHRAGRQQATHQAAVIGQPRLDRRVVIAVAQRLTPIVADVLGDHNFAVAADDALPIRQLDQDGGHQPF